MQASDLASDLFSIGHSNIEGPRFIALLQAVGVTAVADVRSTPLSRHFPWFSKTPLAAALRQSDIAYRFFGDRLGGRPRDAALYRDGIADYEAMARQDDFRSGIADLIGEAQHGRVCLMCAEREPLDCHRCLLVSRELAGRGLRVGHILHDGSIEPHGVTEERLIALSGQGEDLFAPGQNDRLAAAYRHRAQAVAYRLPQARAGRPRMTKRR
jgi:uncharacterized protein (DUF488 family)